MKKIMTVALVAILMAPLYGTMSKEMGMHGTMPNVMVNDTLQAMAGTWTGKGIMKNTQTNREMSFSQMLTSQPTLNNKFLMTETKSNPDAEGNILQGKGFCTYNPTTDKYSMYWFDTMGFGGEFIGQKQGNVITYTYDKPGMNMILTMTLVNENEHRMTMQKKEGSNNPQTVMDVTYTRTTAAIPDQNQPQKATTPYNY